MPKRPQWLAGAAHGAARIVPSAMSHSPFETAEAEPDEEPPGNAVGRAAIHGRAEMGVLAVHRERELVRVGLADEAGAGIEQRLHGRRRPVLMPDSASMCGEPPPVG